MEVFVYERLRELINFLKYTQKVDSDTDFAQKVDIQKTHLSSMLSGSRTITDKTVTKICKRLPYINEQWLLTGEGEMIKSTIIKDEVHPVPEDAYMMAEYADLQSSAGYIGGGDVDTLPETHRRLVPREYEKGNYLVVRVAGDSMNDGTNRSICNGDEILIRELSPDEKENLPIRKRLFVITSKEGNVVKQITEVNKEDGYIRCHSFNPLFNDYTISFDDICQIFVVYKIVQKQITLS